MVTLKPRRMKNDPKKDKFPEALDSTTTEKGKNPNPPEMGEIVDSLIGRYPNTLRQLAKQK